VRIVNCGYIGSFSYNTTPANSGNSLPILGDGTDGLSRNVGKETRKMTDRSSRNVGKENLKIGPISCPATSVWKSIK